MDVVTPSKKRRGPKCKVCIHEERAVIETAMRMDRPLRELAKLWGLSLSSLARHRAHIGVMVVVGEPPAAPPPDVPGSPPASTAADVVTRVLCEVEELLKLAREDKDASYSDRAAVLGKAIQAAGLLGKLRGEAASLSEATICRHPAFGRVLDALTSALDPYPEAMAAVATVLERIERGGVAAA